ncbi:hypothetical protein LTR97_002247 [Elasticomyces elasticus]|uniref:Uncharacterized protein n=1 Tax=Elasticomyces elasticus TaxID=574655 RepID=A0AAN8A4M7_9PEZI|nr:hypothetical protein LTR97_002247 [Elasticomyces elasticus]
MRHEDVVSGSLLLAYVAFFVFLAWLVSWPPVATPPMAVSSSLAMATRTVAMTRRGDGRAVAATSRRGSEACEGFVCEGDYLAMHVPMQLPLDPGRITIDLDGYDVLRHFSNAKPSKALRDLLESAYAIIRLI